MFKDVSTFGLSPDKKNVYIHKNWGPNGMPNVATTFIKLTHLKTELLEFLRSFGESNYIVVVRLVGGIHRDETSIEGSLEDPMINISMNVNFETRNLEYASIVKLDESDHAKELTLPYPIKSEYDYIIVDYNLTRSNYLSISISEESDDVDELQTVVSVDLDEKGVQELEDTIKKWREARKERDGILD
ncbi:hypothetical protein D1872_38140 [compost metagenome]